MFSPKEMILAPELSLEKFDKLLEYLYWERKKEFEIERLKIERGCYDNIQRHGGKQTTRSVHNNAAAAPLSEDDNDIDNNDDPAPVATSRVAAYTKEDIEFNAATSYGLLGESFVGKLAKTKLWSASKSKAESLYNEHKLVIKENFRSLGKITRAKTLLHYVLWGSAIAQRADRWSHAKDIEFLIPAKDDIDLKLVGYSDEQVAAAVEFLQERWKAICPFPDLYINTTLFASRLDSAHAKLIETEHLRDKFNVLEAPYVAKVLEKYDYVDPEAIRARIQSNRYDYKESFRWEIMQQFKKNPPPFITPDPKYPWMQQIPQYLTPYKQELEHTVNSLWEEFKDQQAAWDKERIAAGILNY